MEQIHSTTSKRKWKQLTEKDRYHLEAYFNAGMRTQEIAERMGYTKRTIERERALGLTEQLRRNQQQRPAAEKESGETSRAQSAKSCLEQPGRQKHRRAPGTSEPKERIWALGD